MKTLVLSFVLCLLFGLNYAQSTYYPLIDTGKTWHVMEGGIGGPTVTFTYKVEGDTLINQDDYKILYRSDEEFPVTWTKHGYIREDEIKKYITHQILVSILFFMNRQWFMILELKSTILF